MDQNQQLIQFTKRKQAGPPKTLAAESNKSWKMTKTTAKQRLIFKVQNQ